LTKKALFDNGFSPQVYRLFYELINYFSDAIPSSV